MKLLKIAGNIGLSERRPEVKIGLMATFDNILESLFDPGKGDFSAELAQYLLQTRFSDEQAARYSSLAEKNQGGALTPAEREELEAFVTANTLLMILKSKARRSLVERPSAA
jgi:hypothetical protein